MRTRAFPYEEQEKKQGDPPFSSVGAAAATLVEAVAEAMESFLLTNIGLQGKGSSNWSNVEESIVGMYFFSPGVE